MGDGDGEAETEATSNTGDDDAASTSATMNSATAPSKSASPTSAVGERGSALPPAESKHSLVEREGADGDQMDIEEVGFD